MKRIPQSKTQQDPNIQNNPKWIEIYQKKEEEEKATAKNQIGNIHEKTKQNLNNNKTKVFVSSVRIFWTPLT